MVNKIGSMSLAAKHAQTRSKRNVPVTVAAPLYLFGVGRDSDNVGSVWLSFSRSLSNSELTALHEYTRSWPQLTKRR